VLPLVCILMLVLVMAAALAIDLGRMQVVAVEVQTAADAGALAAAAAAGSTTGTDRASAAAAAAAALAAANRAANAPAQIAAGDLAPKLLNNTTNAISSVGWADANAVEVTARATPRYALAGIAGLAAPAVARRATAAFPARVSSMTCVRPFLVPYTELYNAAFGTSFATAPDMTGADMAAMGSKTPSWRSFTFIGPQMTSRAYADGVWSAMDFTGGSGTVSSFTDWARGVNCGSVAAHVRLTPGAINRGGTPMDFVNAMNAAMNAVCNFKTSGADTAKCWPSPTATVPGVLVRVAIGDAQGMTAGSAVNVRLLTTATIMCYYRSVNDQCKNENSYPGGGWWAPFRTNQYPAGTVVLLMNDPFPGVLPATPDMVFSSGVAMAPIVTGAGSSGGSAMLAR
jgi:Flp pilus assembly protein TadG